MLVIAGLGRSLSKIGKSLGLDPAIFIPVFIGLIILIVVAVIIVGAERDKKFLKYALEEFKSSFTGKGLKAQIDYNGHCYIVSGNKYDINFKFRCMRGIDDPEVYFFELTLPYIKTKDDFKKLPDHVLISVKVNSLKKKRGKVLECFLECKRRGVVPSKFLDDLLKAYSEVISPPDWHYLLDGEDIGPLSDYKIQVLIDANVINAETLARKTDMNEWQPLANLL
ncbi:MAG: DUF4339 domain-containing protein [Lentisphaeraceae bacterium]|nr:DUF4339 domain-containing protein [Lentisphaeraceae bacterium]